MLLCVITSPICTSGTIAKPDSFTALTPECVCGSMSPGVTCLPVASTSTAPAGAASFCPTRTTLPACTSRSAFSRRPCGPCVHTVALRTTSTAGCAGGAVRPNSMEGRKNGRSIFGTFTAMVPRAGPSYASVRAPRYRASVPLGSDNQPKNVVSLTEPASNNAPS